MSKDNRETDEEEIMLHCAGCGVEEDGDIKLKNCTACYLVRYCGVKCQKEHRPKHKKECKKRAAELRDEILFKQPERDCPICCLPLSLDKKKSSLTSCCCKLTCNGCLYASQKREFELRLQRKCPFCRHPPPTSDEEAEGIIMKRVEANDPIAMLQIGQAHGIEGDYKKAFEYFTKAAALGCVDAHYCLSRLYASGVGVEKDEKKRVCHLEEAAIGGHVEARCDLGNIEAENERYVRAIKHFTIAANMGHDKSLELLKKNYANGYVAKKDLASALRAHLAAVKATKSPLREEAEEYFRKHSLER